MNYMIIQLLNLINSSILLQEKGLDQRIDEAFQPVSDTFSKAVFFKIGDDPFVIYLLVGSCLLYTSPSPRDED